MSGSRRSTRCWPRWTGSTPGPALIVHRRHQPPRDPRQRAAPPRPVRPAGGWWIRPDKRRAASDPRHPRPRGEARPENVDLRSIAARTPGFAGADLANLVNEAALTRRPAGHEAVSAQRLHEAIERVVRASEREPITHLARRRSESSPTTRRGTPSSGWSNRAPTRCGRCRSSPRGRALGVTFQSPDVERYGYDVAYLRGRITGALGGRAAEELVYGDITTGAESDLEQVTRSHARWSVAGACPTRSGW